MHMKTAAFVAAMGLSVALAACETPTPYQPLREGAALTAIGAAAGLTLSFLLGALSSGIAGFMGMWVSIRANIRVAAAATTSLNAALQTALRGGAVSGLFTVAMSLLGVGGLFTILSFLSPPTMAAVCSSSSSRACLPVPDTDW